MLRISKLSGLSLCHVASTDIYILKQTSELNSIVDKAFAIHVVRCGELRFPIVSHVDIIIYDML